MHGAAGCKNRGREGKIVLLRGIFTFVSDKVDLEFISASDPGWYDLCLPPRSHFVMAHTPCSQNSTSVHRLSTVCDLLS